MKIPRVFHQIWVGGRPMPAEFLDYRQTWLDLHPGWTLELWTDERLPPLVNRALYDAATVPAQRCDILCIELLHQFGGVYIDCDFECFQNIEPLIDDLDAFAASEGQGWISGGIMGAVAGHPAFAALIDALPGSVAANGHRPINYQSGPVFRTPILKMHSLTVFPPELFYPYSYAEKHRKGETFPGAYAAHHWAASWMQPVTGDSRHAEAPAGRCLPASPSISVIIPTLDEGDWVRRTVDAILSTAGSRKLEVIVVDDGSKDGSCDFLRSPGHDERVRVVVGGGLGVAGARNRGADEATGDIVLFMDAHVIPEANWLDEIVTLLGDPTVGLAGLGVRDFENPASVGYRLIFVNENLAEGWATRPSEAHAETPLIGGACVAARRDVFEEMGRFDPGLVRWGIDDVELSLRAWFLGYRVMVSTRSHIAHYFKHNKPRNFAVVWDDFDVNLLRCVHTYFDGCRLDTVVSAISRRENFERSWAKVRDDPSFWARRESLRARFKRDERWYFAKFGDEFAPFARRLSELQPQEARPMTTPLEAIVCPRCSARNLGSQQACLLCGAPLARQGATAPGAGHSCSNCGNGLAPGAKFCGACGTPVAAADPACVSCGNALRAGAKFCAKCGTAVA
jgi:GT2 family glycosyltransferase